MEKVRGLVADASDDEACFFYVESLLNVKMENILNMADKYFSYFFETFLNFYPMKNGQTLITMSGVYYQYNEKGRDVYKWRSGRMKCFFNEEKNAWGVFYISHQEKMYLEVYFK